MLHFILDTSSIIRDSSILARSSNEVRLAIPEVVVLELASRSSTNNSLKRTVDLVQDVLSHGAFRIGYPHAEPLNDLAVLSITSPRLDIADVMIAKSAESYIKTLPTSESQNAFLVTEDKVLLRYAETLGINAITVDDLKSKLTSVTISDDNLAKRATAISQALKRSEIRVFATGIILGVIVSVIASFVFIYFALIIATIHVWGTIVILPLLGVLLFWFRSRYRLGYGVAEAIFGLVATLSVFIPHFDYSKLNTVGVLQVMAGLYVIVRGLDNIDTGLKGTRFEPYWRSIFK